MTAPVRSGATGPAAARPGHPVIAAELAAAEPALYLLPPAGGSPAAFAGWPARVGPFRTVPVELPGRGSQYGVAVGADMDSVVRYLAEPVRAHLRPARRYAVFGHSTGAAVGYALAVALATVGHPPAFLVVSGRRAPHLPPARQPIHPLPPEPFVREVVALGGTAPAVAGNAELMAALEPTLRLDLTVDETFRWPAGPRLSCPVTMLRAVADHLVTAAEVAGWHHCTTGPVRQLTVPGGHFDLGSAALIAAVAEAAADGPAAGAGGASAGVAG
jgi:medium-chain acyl-[acyl-carrier-protein] hydrolase